MPIPAGIAAAVAAAPTIASGIASWVGGERANKAQREAAREQMAFQERMSSTAYQRAVEDMRMAGINPMLAYAQGGASSPGGAQPDVQDTISPAVSSAQHTSRLSSELKNMAAQRELIASESLNAKQSAHAHFMKSLESRATLAGLGYEWSHGPFGTGELTQIPRERYGLEARRRLFDMAYPELRYDASNFLRAMPEMAVGAYRFAGEGARMVRDFGRRAEEAAKPWNIFDRAARGVESFMGPRPGGR